MIITILGIILLLIIIGGILTILENIIDKQFERGKEAEFERQKRILKDRSIWFSEDKATMNLIKNLADKTDVSEIRDIWRKEKLK